MNKQSHSTLPAIIEMRIEKPAALFDPLDPFPLPTRDLSLSAENFIIGWAREAPRMEPLRIVVHAPAETLETPEARSLPDAMRQHFRAKAERVRGDIRELFRMGRAYLAVGLLVLAACVAGSQILIGALHGAPLGRFLSESLIILGWVANWRPIEVFLYDWRPLDQQRRLFERLSEAPVELRGL